jgi:hypothetical protein
MAEGKEPTDKTSDGGYEVGYRKPPMHTRFKPGQSGNPRGRPKGTKNLKTDLMEELGEKIVIHEGDRSQEISKQRALLKSVVNRAIKGDVRAISIALATMMRLLDTGEGVAGFEEVLREEELEILRAFEGRVRRADDRRTDTSVNRSANSKDSS